MIGIVTKSTGSWYTVYTESRDKIECRLKGKFRLKGIKSTNPVAVGDQVTYEYEEGKKTGVINNISEIVGGDGKMFLEKKDRANG